MSIPKIKLLFVITELYKGGAETALVHLLNSIHSDVFDVDLVVLSQRTMENSLIKEVPDWVKVCNAGLNNLNNGYTGSEEDFFLGGTEAKSFVKDKYYDLAFSYGEWCRLEFVANYVTAREKAVWIHTDITASQFNHKEFFKTFSVYRYYLFVSEVTRKKAIERYPFLKDKSAVIHNILLKAEIEMLAEEKVEDRFYYDYRIRKNRMITVANIRQEKGYERILKVAKELKRRKFPFCWLCIGNFSDAGLTDKLQQELKKEHLEKDLILLGAKENPHPYTKEAEVFVLLSDYEAWPMAMGEAMLLGKPAIATATSGAKEHIADKQNGLLCSFDIEDAADCIEKFFDDKELQWNLKNNAANFNVSESAVKEFIEFVNARLLIKTEESSMAIERLDFGNNVAYNAVEAAIHLNRYAIAKNLCKGKMVLDVASGEGYGSFLLKKWGAKHVDAIDIDAETVEKASQMFGSEDVCFLCHTAEKLPFPDYSFDLITSFETIEHLDYPEKFLAEIKRVLKPDGIIVLSCPNDPYYYPEEGSSNPFHKKKYSFFDFKEMAEQYLGYHVKYYLAFAVNGFMSMPVERQILPPSPLNQNMFELFNYIECNPALCISQGRYTNHWNCNYYVGIWGKLSENIDVTAVIFPRDFFLDVKDEDIEFKNGVKELQNKLKISEIALQRKEEEITFLKENHKIEVEAQKEYQIQMLQEYNEELEEKLKIVTLEQKRTSMMLELSNKEKECIHNSAYANYENYLRANGQLLELNTQITALTSTAEEYKNQLNQYKTELDIMKSTKGYKLLNFIYRFRCGIRRIFKIRR